MIAAYAWDVGDDRMHGRIKLRVDSEHQPAEIRQTCGLRDAGPSDEENFATRMCKKEAFRNSRKTRPQGNHSITRGTIPY